MSQHTVQFLVPIASDAAMAACLAALPDNKFKATGQNQNWLLAEDAQNMVELLLKNSYAVKVEISFFSQPPNTLIVLNGSMFGLGWLMDNVVKDRLANLQRSVELAALRQATGQVDPQTLPQPPVIPIPTPSQEPSTQQQIADQLNAGLRSGAALVGKLVEEARKPREESLQSGPPAESIARPDPNENARPNNIFICYRREDNPDVVGRLSDNLVRHFGRETVFKDVDSIPFGVDFRAYLRQVVEKCSVLLVVIGPQWLATTDESGRRRLDDPRDFVRIELEAALSRDIPVIPLLLPGARIPDEAELPASLKDLAYRNGTVIRNDPDFHPDVERLVNSLKTHWGQ